MVSYSIHSSAHTHWRLLIRKSKVNMQKWLEHWFHWSTFSTSQKSDTKHMHTFISHPCVMSHLWCDNKCTIWNHPIAEKIVSKYLVIWKYISRIVRFNGFTASKCFENNHQIQMGLAVRHTHFSINTLIFRPKNHQITIQDNENARTEMLNDTHIHAYTHKSTCPIFQNVFNK